MAHLTTPESPWPLRLLSAKVAEYISRMSRLWVEGEIIELKRRPNAKIQYFVLADLKEKMSMNVKIWSHALPAGIEEGARVVIAAKPDFWTGTGSFTLHADEVRAVGVGDLLARIEALKAKLAAEGLFAASRKKPLPFLPRTIGLICGRNSKAMHDVVNNTRRRWASAQFEIREVQVQGRGAVEQVIAALHELDALDGVDVIVLARGGGSVEDLFPFSDERLVRAIAAAHTPTVSAIGHETDNPVSDYVADFRASTPTDVAKRIVPDVDEEKRNLATAVRRGRIAVDNLLHAATLEIEGLRSRPVLADPQQMVDVREQDLSNLRDWAKHHIEATLDSHTKSLAAEVAKLRALSPLSTLERGYAVIRTEHGILTASDAEPGTQAVATLADGTLDLTIDGVTPAKRKGI